ncbi:MAG: hypothetical protein IPN69_08530 [Acidobacteria bacterium]|nr:hypothetical protein [Acidobacteriota bacterium]
MLLLASTSDKIQVVTDSAITVDAHASYVDLNGTTTTPGRKNTPITTATTTDVVASPSASTYRTVKTLTVRNRHATTSVGVKVVLTDGTNAMELVQATIPAGDTLHYHEGAGFSMTDATGRIHHITDFGSPAVNAMNLVVLASDVVNNNAVANTIADVTGLSFAVTAGQTYQFEFLIPYTSAATTTGSRWTINGPASPTMLNYTSQYTLTATSMTTNYATAYDIPAASNATSLTAGNVARIAGVIKPSSNGTVIARFASEVTVSAVTAKAGALLKWVRTL